MTLIFHASDLHFGAEDRAALDWFAARVAAERPDAIIITGDLTMRARHREFHAARQWMASLGTPIHVEMGNHDMPYFNPVERIWRPYQRYQRMAASLDAPLMVDGVAVVPLRTTSRAQWRLNWSKGVVRPRALDGAIAGLATAQNCPVRLIAAHHPLVETGTRGTALTHGGNRALHALASAGASAILSGHVHDPFDLMFAGKGASIRMIGAGTLSERLRSTAPSFNRLTISGGNIALAVVAMG